MLEKLLNMKKCVIYSSHSAENIKLGLERLFNKSESNVSGRFNGPKSFNAYDSAVIVAWSMPYLSRQSAYVIGKIKENDNGSAIELSLRPNMILPILAMAIIIVGFTFLAISMNAELKYLIAGVVLLIIGLAYYPISSYFRTRLRNKVINEIS